MTRLPTPGSDDGTWGNVLNDFLEVSHNSDGTLRPDAVQQAGGITQINTKTPAKGSVTLDASDVGAISSDSAGKAGGVATLDAGGNVPVSQLGNMPSGTVPAPTAAGQTIISDSSTTWSTAPALTVDTTTTPPADSQLGSPGTNAAASSSNHSHPLGVLGRNIAFSGMPPSYANDITVDGTWNGAMPSGFGPFGSASWGVSGSTYTAAKMPGLGNGTYTYMGTYCRNLTINAGVTVKPAQGYGLVLVASQSITVNGTIDVSGASATGSTGAGGSVNWAMAYGGGSGGNGGTASGTNSGAPYGGTGANIGGGPGGAGGASGANTGGTGYVAGYGNSYAIILPGIDNWLYLQCLTNNGTAVVGGGYGGGGGAGDGTNAGGGGGAGGGVLILIAPSITIGATGSLKANGGAGAPGTGGNAGGGGGGGGGIIAAHALSLSISSSATLEVKGGTGGAGAGTGAAGAAGGNIAIGNGVRFYDPPVAQGGHGFGNGFLLCQWQ